MNNIETLINEKGFKKSFIAKNLGISVESLRKKLKGLVDSKVSELIKLADILNLSVESLVKILIEKEIKENE